MTQAYSDPNRESDPHALPDIEVYFFDPDVDPPMIDGEGCEALRGWYWWTCTPGCLPDSDASGPFATMDEALADAQGMRELFPHADDVATFTIGDRVEGGLGEDRDTGRIVALIIPPKGECDVEVAWDSGVRTPAVSADLSLAK